MNDRFVTGFGKSAKCEKPYFMRLSSHAVTGMTEMTGFSHSRMCARICIVIHKKLSYLS